MDYLRKFTAQVRNRLLAILIIDNLLLLAGWYVAGQVLNLQGYILLGVLAGVSVLSLVILPWLLARRLSQPTKLIAEAIFHIAPNADEQTPSPDPNSARFGKELVTNLMHQLYDLATIAEKAKPETADADLSANFVASNLPLPLILMDEKQTITYVNEEAAKYIGLPGAEIIGNNFYNILDMMFPNQRTLDKWLEKVRAENVTAVNSWERVRLNPNDQRPLRLFDLAAYYNKDNSHHLEVMLVLFDHTKAYSQDDQSVSFMALSVHELRTPLTLLRGYIEAFEDEFAGKLEPEMNDFMFKMSATAQQLTSFVNNILNVARVDDDQLVLKLQEANWADIVRSAANNLALRAKVRDITLEYSIAPDLPSVGVDRVSIMEVINNLVDNAIKYSGQSHRIRITTNLNNEGLVETTVQDFGVGIPDNIMRNLFTKFYRDHHNRAQIGGTGLGLYLSKAIVTAHGGNIWVKSKLGEGSTFGFTVLPFSQLSSELKDGANNEIVRGAHGWIKNHSLYRR